MTQQDNDTGSASSPCLFCVLFNVFYSVLFNVFFYRAF